MDVVVGIDRDPPALGVGAAGQVKLVHRAPFCPAAGSFPDKHLASHFVTTPGDINIPRAVGGDVERAGYAILEVSERVHDRPGAPSIAALAHRPCPAAPGPPRTRWNRHR